MTRDAAVFAKGKIKGDALYPPFEKLDDGLRREVSKFEVYPFGQITEFPRHIPYNSDKKVFQEKTGRDSFEGWQLSTGNLSVADTKQSSSTTSKFPEKAKSTP